MFGTMKAMVTETKQKRVRKSPEERLQEIVQAATKLVGERGYNGISLKDLASEVGMSQPGLLHYIGSKEGVLSLLITDVYDSTGTPEEFFESGLPGSDPQAPHFPAYLRYLVRCNAQRRNMVQLFVMLEVESLNPGHPLHEYFESRHAGVWDNYSQFSWVIPPQLGTWDECMRPVVRRCIEAMDGIQLRWLREPPIDLYDEWLSFEHLLFPSPVWDNYR